MKITIDIDNKLIEIVNEITIKKLNEIIERFGLQEYKIKNNIQYVTIPYYPTAPFNPPYKPYEIWCDSGCGTTSDGSLLNMNTFNK